MAHQTENKHRSLYNSTLRVQYFSSFELNFLICLLYYVKQRHLKKGHKTKANAVQTNK